MATRSPTTSRKPFFEKCKELGIKNIHVHKGPTIWPLDKDAFDPKDVDIAATENPELNFIVEHVGLPRIEDFCFMATQEPNVYAGLSVVTGGLMYARPRFFAKVMGELLFWVGEDKMLFGSDYGIWEPKWQIEMFLDWDYPDEEYSDYPRVNEDTKRKILGLNAAKLYGIEVPEGFDIAGAGSRGRCAVGGGVGLSMSERASTEPEASSRMTGTSASATAEAESRLDGTLRERVLDALGQVYDPELDEPITQLRFIASCVVSPDGDVDLLLRLPTPQCAPNFAFLMGADSRRVVRAVEGVRNVVVRFEDHYTGDEINSALNDGAGFMGAFPGETEDDDLESLREIFTRKALIGRQGQICEELIDGGTERSELVKMTVAQLPDTPEARRVLELREMLGMPASDDSPGVRHPQRRGGRA